MKTVVIGFDGMDPTLLSQLESEQNFDDFNRLRQEGVSADFDSTTVPISAMAWSFFATSANPRKHGIYNFSPKKKIQTNLKLLLLLIKKHRRYGTISTQLVGLLELSGCR